MGRRPRGRGQAVRRLKRGKPLRSDPAKTREWQRRTQKKLPAESARRKAERPARAKVREEVLERDGGCRGRGVLPGPCRHPQGLPLDVHEVVKRGRWRAGYLVVDNCLALCRAHHDWVETHDVEAKELGFSASANNPG